MKRKTHLRAVGRRKLSARNPKCSQIARTPTPYFWEIFERVALTLTVFSVGIGATAFVIDLEDRKQSRLVNAESLIAFKQQAEVNAATLLEIEQNSEIRADEATARAWSILTTPATGNSGKGGALAYLNGRDIPLFGIDLSCEAMGGGWDEEELYCENPSFLEGISLRFAKLERAKLDGVSFACLHPTNGGSCSDLTGAILWEVSLRGSNFYGASLQHASLWGANFEGATVSDTDFTQADAQNVNFSGSDLSLAVFDETNIRRALFTGANISGADFANSIGTSDALFGEIPGSRAWAWRHTPPIGLHPSLYDICDESENPSGSEPLVVILGGLRRPDGC